MSDGYRELFLDKQDQVLAVSEKAMQLQRRVTELETALNRVWIDVDERLPAHGVNVLATYKNDYGKQCVIVGHHLERWKEESNCDDCNDEYSEELDNYFLKAGWYENQENWGDCSSITIHEGEVSHWMPLPSPPQTAVYG